MALREIIRGGLSSRTGRSLPLSGSTTETTPLHKNIGAGGGAVIDVMSADNDGDADRVDRTRAVRTREAMNCDWIAPFYRTAEHLSFGGKLEACRTAFVGWRVDCRRALWCGDGDGRFLAELLRVNRNVQVDYVDLSAKMIELARRRIARLGAEFSARVRFFVGDVRGFKADGGSYDLIAAHFF